MHVVCPMAPRRNSCKRLPGSQKSKPAWFSYSGTSPLNTHVVPRASSTINKKKALHHNTHATLFHPIHTSALSAGQKRSAFNHGVGSRVTQSKTTRNTSMSYAKINRLVPPKCTQFHRNSKLFIDTNGFARIDVISKSYCKATRKGKGGMATVGMRRNPHKPIHHGSLNAQQRRETEYGISAPLQVVA